MLLELFALELSFKFSIALYFAILLLKRFFHY